MSLNLNNESRRKEEIHEKLAHEPVWHFRKFPKLTINDIEFSLTPESEKLFERGKPDQGYLGLGEVMFDGEILLHLLPAFDIKKSDDPDVIGMGDRPELMRQPEKPEKPTKQLEADKDFMEHYQRKLTEWQDKNVKWQAYLEADKAWMAKWKAWVEKPQNFVDKNGVPFATKEYVVVGDANVKGQTGIGHKRMVKRLGLSIKAGIQSGLIGFGIWKGNEKVLLDFRERSLSQNAYSILWHDQFFKQYVFNGMEFYGVANQKLLSDYDFIDKMKFPAFVICANPPRKYFIIQDKIVIHGRAEIDYRIINRLEAHENKLGETEKNQLISYEKFSNLKAMIELSDESLEELGFSTLVKRTKQQKAIKDEVLFSRPRSLPWALSEKLLAYLLKNLPNTPYTEGGKHLSREVAKEDRRSVLMTNPLFDATKNGELEEVKKWIEAGGSPNEIGCTIDAYDDFGNLPKDGLSLIEVAFKYKQITVFQYLFDHPKFDKEKYYLKMLLKSVEEDFSEILAFLLKLPFTLTDKDLYQQMALRCAAKKGNVDAVKILVEHQVNPLIKGISGNTFHLAVSAGKLKVVETLFQSLVEYGAAVNAVNANNDTLLHLAVGSEEIKIVELLLTYKAAVNVVNNDKNTPLHLAATSGRSDIVELLLKQGASVDAMDINGRTALHLAAINGGLDSFESLLERTADLTAVDSNKQTALHLAVAHDRGLIVELLLKKRIGFATPDSTGKTALHLAALNDDADIAEQLLEVGADIHNADMDGNTPLHLAVKNGKLKVVELLIKRGANLIARNEDGRIPLHLAAIQGYPKYAELMLNKDNSLMRVIDKQSKTPLHLAAEKGHLLMVEALLTYRADITAMDENQPCQRILRFSSEQERTVEKEKIKEESKEEENLNSNTKHILAPLSN